MVDIPDVDLDVEDREAVVSLFPEAIIASQLSADRARLVKHNTGLHFQQIPVDPLNGMATFPYDIAEELGYYKVDVITYHAYDGVEDEEHLIDLLGVAEGDYYPWVWFQEERFFTNEDTKLQVTQLANHFGICQQYPPESVSDVAALIALIRPRKKYLIGEPFRVIREKIWKKLPEEESDKAGNYFFKKSHAFAFALVLLVQMQLLDQKV